jgi:leucyl aminopeptidase
MKVEFHTQLKSKEYPLVVIPFFEDKEKAKEASLEKALKPLYDSVLKVGDFSGKKGQSVWVYPKEGPKRLLLLGMGKKTKDLASIRLAFAKGVGHTRKNKINEAVFCINGFTSVEKEAIFDGILSMNYSFALYKKEDSLIEKVTFISKDGKKDFEKKQKLFSGICLARDLVNENADSVNPQYLAKVAKGLEKKSNKITTKILDKKQIEKEKMGLLLAVNRGSVEDPRLIIVKYSGGKKGQKPIVLVGKGVTYDTGGLSLKPTSSMLDMKCDMGGAAAVLGTMEALAKLGIKQNVIGVVPSTENGIDGASYKIGDVYTSMSKKTVEINNTDAEGRLILADAITYVKKHLDPACIIDLATLTGGVLIALGDEITGMFSDDKDLVKDFTKAAETTGEPIWHMPMRKEYRSMLKSPIADIVNSAGRNASSMTAALFLKEFVEKTPWVHFDIAGTAFHSKPKGTCPTQATGAGVKLLVEFLEKHVAK